MKNLIADRIISEVQGIEPNKWRLIKENKNRAKNNKPDLKLLDFSFAESDGLLPKFVRGQLKKVLGDSSIESDRDHTISSFRQAIKTYMLDVYGVVIDSDKEITHSIGVKQALALLPLCFINFGDIVITTSPGYEVLGKHAQYLGAVIISLPLLSSNDFLPDLSSLSEDVLAKTKLFYINYPNNPTGAVASVDFFDKLIDLARKYEFLIVHDAAYGRLVYGTKPLSILSRPNGNKVAIELHSLTKGLNMSGWRMGFIVGSPELIQAFSVVRDSSFSGKFKALQSASACALLNFPLQEDIREYWETRTKKMVAALQRLGFPVDMPGGSLCVYMPSPLKAQSGKVRFANAQESANFILYESLISVVPYDESGAYLRFCATFDLDKNMEDDQIFREMSERLKRLGLEW